MKHDKTDFSKLPALPYHSMATRSFARWPTDGHMMWMDGYYGFMFQLMLYYPDRGYKRAVHLFRQENQLTRGLLDALKNIGYTE